MAWFTVSDGVMGDPSMAVFGLAACLVGMVYSYDASGFSAESGSDDKI